jgi:hypothetical protein
MQPQLQTRRSSPRLRSDLDQKIQMAKQAGYSDAEIGQFLAQSNMLPQTSSPQTQQKGGRGGTATSLISEAGGIAGAAKGAAIGAGLGSVVPGAGTVIGGIAGGIAGGFGGGFLGRALENKVRDDEFRISQALGEGVSSGVAGGVGGAFRGAKAAKLLKDGAKASRASQTASNLQRSAMNPQVAPTPFAANQQKSILEALKKVPGTNASAKLNNLPATFAKSQDDLTKILANNSNTIKTSDFGKLVANKANGLSQFVGTDKAYRQALNSELRDLSTKIGSKQLSANQLQAIKSNYGSKMTNIFKKVSTGADLNPKEASRFALWSALDDGIIKIAPEAKNLTRFQSQLYKAAPGLLKASQKTAGIPLLGLKSEGVERGLQSAKYLSGRGIEGASRASIPAGTIPNLATRGLMLPPQEQGQQGMEQGFGEQDIMSQLSGALGGQDFNQQGMEQFQQPTQQGRLTQEDINQAILTDLQATGGKNVQAIQMLAEMYGPQKEAGFEDMTADQQRRVQNLNTVASALDNLEREASRSGIFKDEPQLMSTIKGPIEKVVGGASDAKKRQYIASLRSRGIQIIRALGEVGNLSQAEQSAAAANLPTPGDNAETAYLKIQSLRNLFGEIQQSVASPNLTGGFNRTRN